MAKKLKKNKSLRRFQHLAHIQKQVSATPQNIKTTIETNADSPAISEITYTTEPRYTFVLKDLRKVLFFCVFVAVLYGVLVYVLHATNFVVF